MNPVQDMARRRLIATGIVAVAALAALLVRLVSVSLLHHSEWTAIAEKQQQRTVGIDPERGSLL